ncbi:MAG: hypothetical protein JNM17_14325 [Archangium sp.]|nr:hypothetical protein [Archangium sp.]
MIWLAVGLGLVVLLVVIGVASGRSEQKNAPQKLAQAQQAWANKDAKATLAALQGALVEAKDDAGTTRLRDAVKLLDDVLTSVGANPKPLTADIFKGSGVDQEALDRAQKFTESASEKGRVWGELLALDTPLLDVDEQDGAAPNALERTEADVAVTNEVGKAFLFNGPDAVLKLVEEKLPTASPALKIDLLSQRAAAHSMNEKRDLALADYQACVDGEPSSVVHRTNLAESLLEFGRVADAKAHLVAAQGLARTAKQKEGLQKILQWFA